MSGSIKNEKPKLITKVLILETKPDGTLTEQIYSEMQKEDYWSDAWVDGDLNKAYFLRYRHGNKRSNSKTISFIA